MKYILVLAVVSVFIGCGNDSTKNHPEHDSIVSHPVQEDTAQSVKTLKPELADLDVNVTAQVKRIFDHYIHVKTGLVKGDFEEAGRGAKAILKVLRDFDKSLIPADQKKAYDKPPSELRVAATSIVSAPSLAQQRVYFSDLSIAAYDLARSFGAGRTIYHAHCPMAFDNKGAMWLSEEKEINNPYYGNEMLECGIVEEVIENRPQ